MDPCLLRDMEGEDPLLNRGSMAPGSNHQKQDGEDSRGPSSYSVLEQAGEGSSSHISDFLMEMGKKSMKSLLIFLSSPFCLHSS